MQQKEPVSVLVSPLDWGLGHATRCIPIIHELIDQGARVWIATGGTQLFLLKQAFPQLDFLEMPGYEIRYKQGFFLKWGLFSRIPSILRQIRRENEWLKECIRQHRIDLVISDNRYGLYHEDIYSVFMTHQLYIQTGSGQITNRILLKIHYRLIRKFSICWIPDQDGEFSIAGRLSHPPVPPPLPIHYIGILSRFSVFEKDRVKNSLVILLSGPEPQRTDFEKILLKQLAGSNLKVVLVRGLPGSAHSIPILRVGLEIYNHLPSERLNELLLESKWVIARSGYSTIMDLIRLKRNAILVPTPGQPEQEYLGYYMQEKKWMICISQKEFSLENSIKTFQNTKLVIPEMEKSGLKNAVTNLLQFHSGF